MEFTRRVLLLGSGLMALAACSPAGAAGPGGGASSPAGPAVDRSPKPARVGGLSCLAQQDGTTLRLHTAGGDVTFWTGVNLGSTTPGHSPGELAISREDYRRWFGMMGELGVQVLRVYTIHPPHMYEELKAYNEAHPSAPLYLVHGIYLPDESYIRSQDLFAQAPTEAMVDEIRDASAAVHGTLKRAPQRGRASGTWTADVSPWTAAWIVGVEWDPEAGHASDAKNASAPAHHGRYFSSHADATPTERWVAARIDELATHEAKAGCSVPIAMVNWPTADPLQHPEEPLEKEDLLGVDANHVVPSQAWPGGTFASYHAYPYYPDFQLLQPSYANTTDPYRAYLEDLKKHHAGMPLVVTEFGVPSSLGAAHRGSRGRDQGHHTEQESMQMNADMLRMFSTAGLSGGLVFAWLDEWFKFTWNTLPRHAPVDAERRALWHDPLTNEQFFGLIAHDPTPVGRRVVHEARDGVRVIGLNHDASWLHLDLEIAGAPSGSMVLGFDVVPGVGLALPGVTGSGSHDVAVVVDHASNQARCYVRGDLDPVRMDGLPAASLPAPGADGWSIQRLTLNRPIDKAGRRIPADFLVVGELIAGDWSSDRGNTQATWTVTDGPSGDRTESHVVRLRLPWSMLALADPSSLTAVVPTPQPGPAPRGKAQLQDVPTGVHVDGIGLTVATPGTAPVTARLTWEGWNTASYVERRKAGLDAVAQAFRDLGH